MRISDWSSDVCSSDLGRISRPRMGGAVPSIRQPVRGLSQHSLFAVEQLSTFVIAKPNMLSLRRRNLPSHVLLERPKVGHAGAVPEKIGRASCRERVCQSV